MKCLLAIHHLQDQEKSSSRERPSIVSPPCEPSETQFLHRWTKLWPDRCPRYLRIVFERCKTSWMLLLRPSRSCASLASTRVYQCHVVKRTVTLSCRCSSSRFSMRSMSSESRIRGRGDIRVMITFSSPQLADT